MHKKLFFLLPAWPGAANAIPCEINYKMDLEMSKNLYRVGNLFLTVQNFL
jgi:hypothetical protein